MRYMYRYMTNPQISELNLRLTCQDEMRYMYRYTTNPPKSVNSTSTWLVRMKWGTCTGTPPTPQNQWTQPPPDLLGWNEVHVQVHHQPPKISVLNLRLTCWAEMTYMYRYTTNPPKSVNSTSAWLVGLKWRTCTGTPPTPQNQWTQPPPDLLGWNDVHVQVHHQPPKSVNSTSTWLVGMKWGTVHVRD